MLQIPKTERGTLCSVARGTAIVAAVFSGIVAVLMIANYLQSRTLDPIENKPLETLIQQLREEPGNAELREQIRAVDLLSRKALFISQWQLRTGGYLLLAGVVVLLAALKTMDSLEPQLPTIEGAANPQAYWSTATRARQWTAGLGFFLLGTALILAFFSHGELAEGSSGDSAAGSEAEFNANWPYFRGPDGTGGPGIAMAPEWTADQGLGVVWKSAVPKPGFSSPIVWQDQVFVTGGDRDGLAVIAFDAARGDLRWHHRVGGSDIRALAEFEPAEFTGYAAPTPATDGRRVFALFANGQLICVDTDGVEIWQRDLGVPDNHYGHSSSLLIHKDKLIVQYDQASHGQLLALDVRSGTTVWRVSREHISWSSPIRIGVGGAMQLIVSDSRYVEAFNPDTGVKLWSVDCLDGEHGPSPAWANGVLVVANESSEVTGIRVDESGARIIWRFGDDVPDSASPLLTDSLAFIPTGYGVVACLEAGTGALLWDHRFANGFVASPVLLGDAVYALDMSGVLQVFAAGRTFRSIAELSFGEKASGTPAFAHNRLYVRGENSLFCVTGNP